MAGDHSEQLRACLRLHLADGVGPILFKRLCDAFGGAEGVWDAAPSQWRRVEGIGDKTAEAIAAVTDAHVDEELAEADKRGVRLICQADDCYPVSLRQLYDPPAVLYVWGDFQPTDAIAIGVVGSRRCTHYGLEQAERFAQLLGRAGFTVVSGGARGIDTYSHRGSMAAGGRTIAVMGCGLCETYPPENRKLFEEIAAGHGAVISELPMRTAVMGGNFPMRNRIISGLSLGVLVVEAAYHSGSLITAKESAEQGKQVFAVPGRVDSPFSQGTNQLIRNGAILVQNLEDILEHLGAVGESMSVEEKPAGSLLPANLDVTEQSLVEALAGGPLSVDELVRRSGIASGKVIGAMTMLVLKGAVNQQPGNVFARKAVQ